MAQFSPVHLTIIFLASTLQVAGCSTEAANGTGEANQTEPSTTDIHVDKLSSIVMRLGVQLHQVLHKQYPKKNFVFSPYCLATSLSILYAGSSGATRDQIEKLLGMESLISEDELHHTFQYVQKTLKTDIGNTTLRVANGIFTSKGLKFQQGFTDLVEDFYHGETFSLDFDDTKSIEHINTWISNQTDNLIEEGLGPGMVHPPVLLLLLSIAHFQGLWTFPFDPKKTKLSQFYLAPNIGKSMYMMQQEKQRLFYGDVPSLKSKILELPFEGDALSFYIILPNDITGLAQVERVLSSDLIWQAVSRMVLVNVELVLPRFKLDTRLDLHSSLGALGSELLLSPSLAQLSGIVQGPNLFVSGMTQNTVFELTEKGVEAASLLGQQIALSAINSVYQVTVDHPFLFFILDKRTKIPLFMGRMVIPPEGSDMLAKANLDQQDSSRGSRALIYHSALFTALVLLHTMLF